MLSRKKMARSVLGGIAALVLVVVSLPAAHAQSCPGGGYTFARFSVPDDRGVIVGTSQAGYLTADSSAFDIVYEGFISTPTR
jgi:hypothetical protein